MKNIERILHKDVLLSMIIRADYKKDGIDFFTPDEFSQQLGYMNRPKDYVIAPHRHNLIERKVMYTQEVLIIRSGKVRADFYDDNQNYIKSSILFPGDVILLASGGHGFQMIEQSEIIEVKQGPYCGELDKVRFDPVSNKDIILN